MYYISFYVLDSCGGQGFASQLDFFVTANKCIMCLLALLKFAVSAT